MNFCTAFDPAENRNKGKIYDRSDNVDRCSYVDSTRLIERFIFEGNNLNTVRAKALQSGLYGYDEAMQSISDPVLPVYETDPTLLEPIIEQTEKVLKSRLATKSNDDLNDEALSKSDLTERSPDVEQK